MTNDRPQFRLELRPLFLLLRRMLLEHGQTGGMRMTVYADEAFLLNGAVDYLLLICAAKLGGGRIARLRLLAAALFGGLYAAAALFAPLGVLQGLPMKLVSLVIMLLIAFGAGRQTLRTGLLFLAAVCGCCGLSRAAVRDRRFGSAGRHVLRGECSGPPAAGRASVYALLYRLFLHGPAWR